MTAIALILPAVFVIERQFTKTHGSLYVLAGVLTAAAFLLPINIRKPAWIGKIGLVLTGAAELALLLAGAIGDV